MIIINIDITISKTDMIIFEIEITYVSNHAHPCSGLIRHSITDEEKSYLTLHLGWSKTFRLICLTPRRVLSQVPQTTQCWSTTTSRKPSTSQREPWVASRHQCYKTIFAIVRSLHNGTSPYITQFRIYTVRPTLNLVFTSKAEAHLVVPHSMDRLLSLYVLYFVSFVSLP